MEPETARDCESRRANQETTSTGQEKIAGCLNTDDLRNFDAHLPAEGSLCFTTSPSRNGCSYLLLVIFVMRARQYILRVRSELPKSPGAKFRSTREGLGPGIRLCVSLEAPGAYRSSQLNV